MDNRLLSLEKLIQEKFPAAGTSIDKPRDEEKGIWYLDLILKGAHHVIGWKSTKLSFGFAESIGTKGGGYGESWPETFETAEAVLERLAGL